MKTYMDAQIRNIELTNELIKYENLLKNARSDKVKLRYINRICTIRACIKINYKLIIEKSNNMIKYYDN